MFEKEKTFVEDFPVMEKPAPVTGILDAAIGTLTETAMLLSVILQDISGKKPELKMNEEAPHCLKEQAGIIARISDDTMRMARDIKIMIS